MGVGVGVGGLSVEKDDRVVCCIHQTADYEIGWRSSFSFPLTLPRSPLPTPLQSCATLVIIYKPCFAWKIHTHKIRLKQGINGQRGVEEEDEMSPTLTVSITVT